MFATVQEAAAQGQERQAALTVALVVWVRPQQRAAFSAWLCFHRAAAETRQLVGTYCNCLESGLISM